MAKNILITPYRNSTNPADLPKIDFINGSTDIVLEVQSSTQSLTFTGTSGTLLTINDDLTGTTLETTNLKVTGTLDVPNITQNLSLNDFVVVDTATGEFYYRTAPTGTSGTSGVAG